MCVCGPDLICFNTSVYHWTLRWLPLGAVVNNGAVNTSVCANISMKFFQFF